MTFNLQHYVSSEQSYKPCKTSYGSPIEWDKQIDGRRSHVNTSCIIRDVRHRSAQRTERVQLLDATAPATITSLLRTNQQAETMSNPHRAHTEMQ